MHENSDWDDWQTRLQRYALNEFYYSNLQYDNVNKVAQMLKRCGALYVNTRSVYNPVYRLVNVYADKVYSGTVDYANLSSGAFPVVASPEIVTALKRLLRWSNWNSAKQLYVRTGEKYGDVFLRVVDNVASRRVALEVVEPQKVRYVRKDTAGNIKEIWFEYYQNTATPSVTGTTASINRKVTEVITQDLITIYHDDAPVDRWPNVWGFVPVTHALAVAEGRVFGSTRYNSSRVKIDEINSQASLLNDQTRKAIIPYIATIGVKLDAGSLTRSADTMDEIINLPLPAGTDIKMLAPSIDIASALRNIEAQLAELREDNPELFLYQLTNMSVSPSGTALRQFMDLAVNKILGAQGVYDDALNRACQMALTIGGVQGYADFEGFTMQSFAQGQLDFDMLPRDVLYEDVDQQFKINALMQSGAPQQAIWTELKIAPETQEQWLTMLEEQNDTLISAQLAQMGAIGGDRTPELEVD